MKIVGLTGGIGSGKTTVAKAFNALGVPVYIADEEAKKLMNTSKVIKRQLIELFGEYAYIDNKLNKSYIASLIFNDKTYLEKMNAIVHPKVASHFKRWVARQNFPYIIKEVAILFENGGDKTCDYIITVVAPLEIKMERLLKRDNTTEDKIKSIMQNQFDDDKKIKKSHFVINNIYLEDTKNQVFKVHEQLLNNCQKP